MSLPKSDLTKLADGRTTMELGPVLPKTAEVRDGHLFIGGVDMVGLAQEQGTALYVYDKIYITEVKQQMLNFVSVVVNRIR